MRSELYEFMEKDAGRFQDAAGFIRRKLPGAVGAVENAAGRVGDGLRRFDQGVEKIDQRILSGAQGLAGSVRSGVANAAGAVAGAGRNAVQAVEQGARAVAGAGRNAVQDVRVGARMAVQGSPRPAPHVPGAPVGAHDTTFFDPHAKPGAPSPPVGGGPSMTAEPGLTEQKAPWWKRSPQAAPAAAPAAQAAAAPTPAAPPSAGGFQAPDANAHGASASNGWEHAQHGKPVAPPQYDAATGAYTAYYPNKADPRSAIKATYLGHEAPTPAGPSTPYEHLTHGVQGLAQQGLQSARRAAPWMAGTAAVGAGGYALSRAGRSADEQEARMRDYYANATHQMPQPVPGMGVYASYDEFANEKIASLMGRSDKLVHHAIHGMDGAGTALLHPVEEAKGIYARMQGEPTEREPGTSKVLRHAVSAGGEVAGGVRDLFGGAYKKADGPPPRYDTLGPAHNAFAGAFGNALATKFVSDPIDGIHRILKKKIVDDPKAHATFHGVIESDPDLQKHYAQNPGQVDDTFKALRKFGPSMATSPAVVRSFLRQSMMTGGNMDFATIRMLAETEKFIQNGRGQGK